MEKEEILNASRSENQKKDLVEIEVENKAGKIAAIGLLILSTVFYVAEAILKGVNNYGWYAMIALYCSIVFGYKAIKLKKKLNIFCAIIWAIVTIVCVYLYIQNIILTSTIL